MHGNTLERFDEAWQLLRAFYGPSTPETFQVAFHDDRDGTSHFDVDARRVIFAPHAFENRPRHTLVHEGSHICLAEVTAGASTLEQFRFIDEGLATILQHRVSGDKEGLRKAAHQMARGQLAVGNLSLQRLQQWSNYFGIPGKTPRKGFAYMVGASFDLYVAGRFGEETFRRFLEDLGKTRDLGKSVQAALGVPLAELEAAWVAEIEQFEPATMPSLVESFPAQDARDVETTVKEITVTFDVDMAPDICVVADCSEGLCYTGARWKGPRVLAIAADRALLPRHEYQIRLGSPGHCALKSAFGFDLAPVVWRFRTR